MTFRYELRLDDGGYAGTFVTAVPNWQVGDTFTTGDGRDLRIIEIVPVDLIEVSSERPAFALWEVEPAGAAAGGGEAERDRRG
jgi:hypothetical protein